MAERKTSKETYRDSTLQSVKDAKTEGKKKPSDSPKRSGSLQSIRGTSDKKKVSKSKGVVRNGK